MRWEHPQRGLVPPSDFISVAEETGFIVPLGLWVLREACRKAFVWSQEFGRARAPSISVNLSPRQFAQADIVDSIRSILIETGVNPRTIKLEITESSAITDPERAVHVLNSLKAFGLQLSVDDFGTGYSSLSYLHRLPIDVVKIDRSFVSAMMANRESRQIIKTILLLAGSLNLKVVAEGIETVEQVEELRKLGCEFGQGYLFSRPLIEAAADDYLQCAKKGDRAPAEREAPDNPTARLAS